MRKPSWNVRTDGTGHYRAYYEHHGRKHRLRGGTFRADFPIPSPAVLKSIARSTELTGYLAAEVNADKAAEWIGAFITRTNPQLDGRQDLPALAEWIRLSVGHYLEEFPPAARLRDRPDNLADLFAKWERRRRDMGASAAELSGIRTTAAAAAAVLGRRAPIDTEPTRWELVQRHLAQSGKTRQTVAKYLKQVCAMFDWAAYQGWVRESVAHRLALLPRLPQDAFRETEPIKPVDDESIRAVAQARPSRKRTRWMIRIQRLIGCRPGELCRMRWDEISRHPGSDGNRSSRWHWRPSKHKTKHRGKSKLYVIGPRAQHMLEMWEAHRRSDSPYVFTTKSGRPVSRTHYRDDIHAICDRIGIARWNPNQIRHTRATEVSSKYGAMAEAASLQHTAKVAQLVYVERDLKLAERVAKEIG
jgi:integrase